MILLKFTFCVRGCDCDRSALAAIVITSPWRPLWSLVPRTKEPRYGTEPGWKIPVTNSGRRAIVCNVLCPQVTEYTVVNHLFYCTYNAGSGVWVLPSFRDAETHLKPLKYGRMCSVCNTCTVLCIYVFHVIFRITGHYFLINRWKQAFIPDTAR